MIELPQIKNFEYKIVNPSSLEECLDILRGYGIVVGEKLIDVCHSKGIVPSLKLHISRESGYLSDWQEKIEPRFSKVRMFDKGSVCMIWLMGVYSNTSKYVTYFPYENSTGTILDYIRGLINDGKGVYAVKKTMRNIKESMVLSCKDDLRLLMSPTLVVRDYRYLILETEDEIAETIRLDFLEYQI